MVVVVFSLRTTGIKVLSAHRKTFRLTCKPKLLVGIRILELVSTMKPEAL